MIHCGTGIVLVASNTHSQSQQSPLALHQLDSNNVLPLIASAAYGISVHLPRP